MTSCAYAMSLVYSLEKFWDGIEVQHLKWEVGDREAMIQPVINDKFKMGLDIGSP